MIRYPIIMPNGVLNEDIEIARRKFGRWNVIVYRKKKDGGLVASFLDLKQDKVRFPDGQFTGGCYYVSTLLGEDGFGWDIRKANGGLNLYGGVPEWTVDAATVKKVGAWLVQVRSGKIRGSASGKKDRYRYVIEYKKSEPPYSYKVMDGRDSNTPIDSIILARGIAINLIWRGTAIVAGVHGPGEEQMVYRTVDGKFVCENRRTKRWYVLDSKGRTSYAIKDPKRLNLIRSINDYPAWKGI